MFVTRRIGTVGHRACHLFRIAGDSARNSLCVMNVSKMFIFWDQASRSLLACLFSLRVFWFSRLAHADAFLRFVTASFEYCVIVMSTLRFLA